MAEYYIRKPDSEHARGPLSLQQMKSMAETDQIKDDTLLYDEVTEKWKPITAYEDLYQELFPPQQSLSLKKIVEADAGKNEAGEVAAGTAKEKVTADEILAAAEGDTKETRHMKRVSRSREKAAELAVPGIGSILLVGAVALLYPGKELIWLSIQEQTFLKAISSPMIAIGLFYLTAGLLTFLGLTQLFPIIRIGCAIQAGFLAYLFWSWENVILITASSMLGLGIFIATISLRHTWMIVSLAVGLIGATILAYASISESLHW